MRKNLLTLLMAFLALTMFAQERLYTDKELGGADGGIVGKIEDNLNVTPMGQLSYEIPIPALTGTAGMKPCLSVCYNSSTKEGLFGYGFDLQGLSIISRVPSDLYHEGMASVIDFRRDHFALDGGRLIQYAANGTAEREYRTENDVYSKIVSKGSSYNPDGFTVYTKSGLIYDYLPAQVALGSSKNDSTLFWLVTKVSDTKGNYFTVSYQGDATTNDFRPSKISYTGNDREGLSPYASLQFFYTDRKYSSTSYVYGMSRVKRSKLVSTIYLYMGEQPIRSFTFNYAWVNRKYHLSSVTEKAPTGIKKNPTSFKWSNLDNFNVSNMAYDHISELKNVNLYVGDFNGDGKADFIATPNTNNNEWKGWKLYLSKGTSLVSESSGAFKWPEDKLEQVVCGDFNGDGHEDIIVKRYVKSGYHNCDLYLSQTDSFGKTILTFYGCVISLKSDYGVKAVELNGDGAADLFLWLDNSKECKLIYSEFLGGKLKPLSYAATRYCGEKWDAVDFGDFNGDGLTDVINRHENGYVIMYSDGAGTMTKASQGAWPNKYHHVDLGDFNGDGKTDMLLTAYDKDPNKQGWSEWCINYSRGDGTFAKEYQPKPFDARSMQLFIADYNGDGFDDVQAIPLVSNGTSMTQPIVYLNDATGIFYKQEHGGNVYATDKWIYYLGDFNGDGKMDLLCTSNWSKSDWSGYQLYLMPSETHNLLTGITDGMGNATEVEYKYLSDASVFTPGTNSEYPLASVGSTWPVVASVSTPNGVGGTDVTSYAYENALFHKKGRGMLGFEKVKTYDKTHDVTTVSEYEVNKDKYVIGLKSNLTYIGKVLTSKATYTNDLVVNKRMSGIFSYVPTNTHQVSYEYNTGGIISDITTESAYDAYGNVTQSVVKSGNLTTTTMNTYVNNEEKWLLGRLTKTTVTKEKGASQITKSTEFTYDENSGLLTSESFEPNNSSVGYTKTYVHDGFGNIVKSTVSPKDGTEPRTTKSEYDSKGRFVKSSTNPLDFVTSYTMNDALGVITSVVDANGIQTKNQYNIFGNLQGTETPISKSLRTVGWSKGMTDAPANSLYFEWTKTTGNPQVITFYDALGRNIRTVTETVGGKKIYADVVYNAKGEVEKTSEPYFPNDPVYWNVNEYDAAGRTISQISPDGNSYVFEYDGLTTVTTDPTGSTVSKTNDLNGLLVKSVDNDGGCVEYQYDADGNCVKTKGPCTTIEAQYDLSGNRISLKDPDLGTSKDTYNAYGELTHHEDGYGEVSYEYDKGGRVVSENRPDLFVDYTYDEQWKGALDASFSSGDINASKNYEYDQYGRVVKETDIIERINYVTETAYDSEGHVSKITYPSGLEVQNNYAACGMQVSVTNAKTGQLYWKLNAINARGQIEKEEFGNGLVSTIQYDAKKGTVASIYTPGIQNWTYSFDGVGNLASRRDVSRNLTETFSYDGLHRLTEVRKNGITTQTLAYDAAGNIVRKSDIGNYLYEEGSNRLSSIKDCVYKLKDWKEVQYCSLGKISYVKSSDGTMTIDYGPDKSRIRCTINGKRKYYPNGLFEETIDATVHNTSYVQAFGKTVAIVTDSPDDESECKTMYVHHDHLGSIQAYSDEKGRLYQELSYDAWGMRRNPATWDRYDAVADAKAWKERGFGGHEHLDLFEMVNMDGRMYDPVVGRFLSPDPFVQSPDFTQGLNRYAYCLNNPLSLIDPSGYSWFSKNWKSLTAACVGIAVSVVTAGAGVTLGTAIAAGAAGGAASALACSLLNGSNIGQVAKSTFTGAFWGAVGGAANHWAGDVGIKKFWRKIAAHTVSEGVIEGLQGGNVLHGFMMGATSSLGGSFIDKNLESWGKVGEIAANSILSGTLDELGGGKFANGAITGAFSMIFNEFAHRHFSDKILKKIYDAYVECSTDNNDQWIKTKQLCLNIGGEIGKIAGEVKNGCAIRLSYALNKAGFKVPYVRGKTLKGGDGRNYFLKASEMAKYLRKWYLCTASKSHYAKNGIVFQHPIPIWVQQNISGHVDVVYRNNWASHCRDEHYRGGAPGIDYITDIYH